MKHGEQIRANMLNHAMYLARGGLQNVTFRAVGRGVGMSGNAVYYHFPTRERLLAALADHAIKQRDRVVIDMFIAARHPSVAAFKAPRHWNYV